MPNMVFNSGKIPMIKEYGLLASFHGNQEFRWDDDWYLNGYIFIWIRHRSERNGIEAQGTEDDLCDGKLRRCSTHNSSPQFDG